ncbi:acyl--CoA ligase [Streptomyces sp. NBC_00876]|uniref:AMP-binding protein n=1 Tax=Streptomyces sp. NBC_00876 TaxID=2975853 RepID=UPI00386F5ACD|nr:acyl--CoA ligase [Streptomyces sp. NBC_00876]
MTSGLGHVRSTTLWEAGRVIGWDATTRQAERFREQVTAARPSAVAAAVPTGQALVTVLVAARGLGSNVVITGPTVSDTHLAALGVDTVVEWPDPSGDCTVRRVTGAMTPSVPAEPGLWLLSSGTTGEPKPTHWPWRSLAHGEWGRGNEHWAIGYAPHSFAGVSATCQALGRAATLEFVRPAELAAPRPDAAPLTVAAATPSFWRLAAIATRDPAEFRRVDTVTIGGEPTDASLLRLLSSTVAPRRIKQIFGTTELGTVIHVDDGQAGLPEELRGRRLPSGAAFDVRDGKLCISVAPDAPFVDTGDQVRIDEGRVHVVGRAGVFVNVGGLKANPYRVAQVLQQHESVLAARAYGLRNPLLGQVVAADVVLRRDRDPLLLIPELKRYSAGLLDAHERPQRIRSVESLAVAESGKVQL